MKRNRLTAITSVVLLSLFCNGALADVHDMESDQTYFYAKYPECGDTGIPCQATVSTVITSIASSGSNWIINGYIDWAKSYDVYADTLSTPLSTSYYTFYHGMIAHTTSTEFSGVPALDIDFAGKSTDGSGNFSFSIPKTN